MSLDYDDHPAPGLTVTYMPCGHREWIEQPLVGDIAPPFFCECNDGVIKEAYEV